MSPGTNRTLVFPGKNAPIFRLGIEGEQRKVGRSNRRRRNRDHPRRDTNTCHAVMTIASKVTRLRRAR